MKNATKEILSYFPMLEKYLNDNDNVLLFDETLSNLTDEEATFLKLVWFFENPDEQNFNLEMLYNYFSDDWLEFAIETIDLFFKHDTYLIKRPTTSFVSESKDYLNQTEFADLLVSNGVPFTRQKVNIYLKRGKMPQPDLTISNSKFWLASTCLEYLNEVKSVQDG